jgi:hypothetical protein
METVFSTVADIDPNEFRRVTEVCYWASCMARWRRSSRRDRGAAAVSFIRIFAGEGNRSCAPHSGIARR